VRLEVLAGRLEIVEGRFRLDELQMHQAAGGVVDVDQQGALRTAVLEPPVL
jgi:predicted ATPase